MDERVEAIRKRLEDDAATQSGIANAYWWGKHVALRKDAAYLLNRLDEAVRLLCTMWEEGTLPNDMEHDVAALVAARKGESNG